MGLPRGLEHFSNFFKEYEDSYVIIGGGAASAYLDDAGLEFRTTKDIDMVLFTNKSKGLNKKISEYISLGKFEMKERTDDTPRYYRFSKPEDKDFPEIVEIFAKVNSEIELKEGQYIGPIQNDGEAQLSAILLDEEYFNLIKENSIKSYNGYSIINPYANICLKARAYRELQECYEDSKKVRKHLKDVLRLTQALEEKVFPLSGRPKEDFETIYTALGELSRKEVKQVVGDIITKDDALDILNKCFRQ
jgi:hypothetical protein